VTHLAEARNKEVIAAMIRSSVLLNVGKLHKLREGERGRERGKLTLISINWRGTQ
jgi:hypothetical protein